jgi:hypothetical protein
MTEPFTPEQITALSAEIDSQLRELAKEFGPGSLKGAKQPGVLPEKQCRAIEQATGEEAKAFLQRFKQATRKDLCKEGGVLYQQWKRWGDLSNEKVLESFGVILVAMGFSGNALPLLAVSLGVIVLHLGVKTICEEE